MQFPKRGHEGRAANDVVATLPGPSLQTGTKHQTSSGHLDRRLLQGQDRRWRETAIEVVFHVPFGCRAALAASPVYSRRERAASNS